MASENGESAMKGVQWKVWLGLALLIIGFMTPSATASSHELTTPTEFREEMRRLWEEHILWTRLTIISMVDGLPDAEATTARLLQNEADIGNVIKPFYGNAAGDRLTALLQQHV